MMIRSCLSVPTFALLVGAGCASHPADTPRTADLAEPITLEPPSLSLTIPQAAGTSLVFSRDGRYIASTRIRETFDIWDAITGRRVRTIRQTVGGTTLCFSPDGRWVAAADYDYDDDEGLVRLWDVHTGSLRHTLRGHTLKVRSVVFSPDGNILASGGWDRSVKLWDPQTGKLIRTLGRTLNPDLYEATAWLRPWELVPQTYIESLAFSPDGKLLASTWNNRIRLWDVSGGFKRRTLRGHTDLVEKVVFSPDGATLASSGGYDATVKLWDVASGKLLRTIRNHLRKVDSVAYSPDGKMLAISGWVDSVMSGNSVSVVIISNAATGERLYTFPDNGRDTSYEVAFSPNGKTLAVAAGRGGGITLWKISVANVESKDAGEERGSD